MSHADALAHLTQKLAWSGRPSTDGLAGLPGNAAVLAFFDADDRFVQLLTSQHLRRTVLARLLAGDAPTGRRTDLAAIVRGVRWRAVSSAFEGRWWYYRLARALHPNDYRRMIDFGPAWFLHVNWGARVPEIAVRERIWCEPGQWIGPWPTQRTAQQALEGLWSLFELCRYPEQVRRAPAGTRCAYADMGRCDAPCDGSTPLSLYVERCRAAWRFARGAVVEWMDGAAARMAAHVQGQQFERAALLRDQLTFARLWHKEYLGRVRVDDEMSWLLLVPAVRRRAWKAFAFERGRLREGPLEGDRKIAQATFDWLHPPSAADPAAERAPVGDFTSQLERGLADTDAVERMEQTWLVAHLLHHREGESVIVLDRAQVGGPQMIGDAIARKRAGAASAAGAQSP